MMRYAIAATVVLLSGSLARGQGRFDNVEIKATHVAGKVYMLEGAGGNIGVSVGDDGILMVDDQFAPLADKIRKALKDLNPGNLEFVLNTHWHGDHTGSNPIFGREAHIIAHHNVRRRLSTRQVTPRGTTEAIDPGGWPVITFEESVAIHFNGEEVRVIHYPKGHTDGDSVVYFTGSNVVHMGDLLFNQRFPFIDLDSGGDVNGFIRNVQAVIDALPAGAKVIAGHGPLADKNDLDLYVRMLQSTTDVVRRAIKDGKSLPDIQSAGLPKEWDSWSWSFIDTNRWLEIVHRSLTR